MKTPAIQRVLRRSTWNENDCWEWQGAKTKGYGVVANPGGERLTHRISYIHFKGPIPDGLVLDHLCRNPSCCNPHHLEAVTQRTNTLRGVGIPAVNAAKTLCQRGHDRWKMSNRGRRYCMECHRIDERERQARTRPNLQDAFLEARL